MISTPFGRACRPGEVTSDGLSCWEQHVPYHQLMATLRLLINSGETLDSDPWLFDLTAYELRYTVEAGQKVPSQWILDDILPSHSPYSYDSKWWQMFLLATLRASTMHPCFLQVVRCADKAAVRVNFIYWILALKHTGSVQSSDASQAEFEALAEYSGGISFLQRHLGKIYSPLSAAMESGFAFSKFRVLFRKSPWDLRDLVRSELRLWKDGWATGWTEETLISLFSQDLCPFIGQPTRSCMMGDHCARALHVDWDYPFERLLRRVKEQIELDGMPDDAEIERQMAWDDALRSFENGVCYQCFVDRSKSRWKFLHYDIPNYDEEITIYDTTEFEIT